MKNLPRDVARALAVVEAWAAENGRVVHINKPRPRTVASREDVLAVIAALPSPRERAFMRVLLDTGAEVDAVRTVPVSAYASGGITVEGTAHTLEPETIAELEAWMPRRVVGSEYLFSTANGSPVTRQALHRSLRAANDKAGTRVTARQVRR